MPNWCTNRITISGEAAHMAALYALIETKDSAFDFDAIVPMPVILKSVQTGSRTFTVEGEDVTVKTWWQSDMFKDETARLLTPEEEADLATIGYTSWYDWRLDHWGCKWEASQIHVAENAEDFAEYEFDTPWGPPNQIIDALREQFPDLHISAFYDEPGMQIAGYY